LIFDVCFVNLSRQKNKKLVFALVKVSVGVLHTCILK